ncbi:MAG TPA: FecR family protein, partial [Candidatus Aquilonibacter sp.]|nr:FecR family protein [Candidatus Aquilonibacter sp.]
MKALSSSMLALVLAAMPIVCSPASTDKTLQAKEGTVTYGASQSPTTKLAKNASATLNDNDYAKTGAGNSMAQIIMPDSSVVTMAANSRVQMRNFDNVGGTNTANFVVVGRVRFKVEHPAGAKANYTFSTPTGQIAVRGTEGDIFAQPGAGGAPGGLQVNVYALTNPALPVQVTLVNGQVFTLAAGQSLVVTAAAGAIVGAVGAVSNTTFAPFTQLGAPANASSLGITTTTTTTAAAGTTAAASTTAAATTASVTTAAVAAGTAAAVAVTQNSSNPSTAPSPSPTPTPTPTLAPTATPTIAPTATPTVAPTMTPSPSPAPTGTSVPIIISGKPAVGPPMTGGPAIGGNPGAAANPPAPGPVTA